MVLVCVLTGIIGVCVFLGLNRKIFAVFQQCGYSARGFIKTLKCSCFGEIERLTTYSLTYFLYSLVFSPFFVISERLYFGVLALCSAAYSLAAFFKSKPVKDVRITRRFLRILVLSVMLIAAFGCCLAALSYRITGNDLPLCLAVSLTVLISVLLSPFFLAVSTVIWLPYDRFLFARSIKKCKKNLSAYPDMITIGITGSFGKTSVKNILQKMLSVKYRVVATPLSYNTPLGICKAAKEIDSSTEIFIAEMGAKKAGDIKELCEIVRPDVGIITGICGQHLETFLSVENVKKTKNELVEALPLDGYAFFSSDSEGSKELFSKCRKRKCIAGASGGEVYAKNVTEEKDGTRAEVFIGGNTYVIKTALRGRGNIGNICLAAAVALKFSIKPEQIVTCAERLKPVPHRLEVISANGVTVIDDSYNANIESVKSAAEVLRAYDGKKFVVTPGIVECGDTCETLNERAGRILAQSADEIIAVGYNSRFIASGAKGTAHISEVKNLDEAKKILQSKLRRGDAVLFLNDLPDKFGV